jgi:hypothetical protein
VHDGGRRTDGRTDGTRQRADEKQGECVSVGRRRDSAAPTSSSNQNRGGKREREGGIYQSRTRTKKKGGSFHQKGVVKRLGVSIRGGVPVDMLLSVPRLPLRLHSLAASRTGSKRFAREDDEDAETDADADMDA